MQEPDDIALLRQYTEQNSEEAFAALVTRHVNKVYSVALRHTRNPHQAEEITQAVFVILANKSRHLGKAVILSGWLYQTARLTAVTFIRSEIRRAGREQEVHMQNLLNENEVDVWPQIAPLLDAAMAGLSEADRHAVVLRFFDGKSMREVGAALGASEDAAKMRLNRAVEKLRGFFTKRGVVLPATVLTAAISANSVQAAPAVLAKTATTVAFAKGAAASGSTFALIKGALKVMAWTKAKIAAGVGVAVILATGTGFTLYKLDKWEVISLKRISYDRSTPKGALFFMRRALVSGDSDGYIDSFQLTDQDEALRSSLKQMVQSFAELHRVLAAKYGEASANVVIQNTAPGLLPKKMIDSAQEKPDGGRMLISFGEPKIPKAMVVLELVQSDGVWKLRAESLFLGVSKEKTARAMTQFAVVIQRIIPEVQKGAYPDAGAVRLAIKHEMN
jgi:RNA polymerase sigma factor (sigma-70 family)